MDFKQIEVVKSIDFSKTEVKNVKEKREKGKERKKEENPIIVWHENKIAVKVGKKIYKIKQEQRDIHNRLHLYSTPLNTYYEVGHKSSEIDLSRKLDIRINILWSVYPIGAEVKGFIDGEHFIIEEK